MKHLLSQATAHPAADHTVLDRIRKPIFLIDMNRAIRSCNQSGRNMLAGASAPLHTIGGRLHGGGDALEQAITLQTAALDRWLSLPVPDQFFPVAPGMRSHWVAVSVSCLCTPADPHEDHQERHVLLVVHPVVSIRPVEPALLQAALTLTRQEAQVAALIYAGHSLRETASKIGIGQSTAKTHLQNVFSKNRISKQTELVHLVASLSSV